MAFPVSLAWVTVVILSEIFHQPALWSSSLASFGQAHSMKSLVEPRQAPDKACRQFSDILTSLKL